MKKGIQKFCAAALSVSLMLGAMTVAAADVPSSPPVYSVNVEKGQVQFLRAGEVAGAFTAKVPVDLILFTSESGELIVQFPQPDGTRKSITLADQKTLHVDGQFGRMNLDKSLSAETNITLEQSASADLVLVQSGGQVTINGKPDAVTVSGAAKVSLGPDASISALQVTEAGATVQAAPGAVVTKAAAANKSSLSGISAGSKTPLSFSGRTSAGSRGSSSGSSGSRSSQGASSSSSGNASNFPAPAPPTPIPPTPVPPVDPYKDAAITGIYPTAGKVRIELNKAAPLEADAFYISCPTGTDMTIVSVKTVDGADHNRIYDLQTAHYDDNTYVASVTLPNGKILQKQFVVDSLIPDIYDYRVKRIDAHSAQFSFTSDDAGTVYYMAMANNGSRSAIGTTPPQTAQELKRDGASQAITGGNNVVSLSGLSQNVAYTVYLAVADTNGAALSDFLPKLSVPAAPESNPDTGDISIQSIEQIKNKGFRVVLSAPTARPLDISAFYAKCPAQSALHLGWVETTDNQTYDVYLESGWYYYSNNTYEVKVTFPDGKTATGSFYAETYPTISLVTPRRIDASTVEVTFKSDKPGIFYYGTCLDYDSKPTLEWVFANGEKAPLLAGDNRLILNNVPANHERFYWIAVDEKGNCRVYVDSTAIKKAIAIPTDSDQGAYADLSAKPDLAKDAVFPETSLPETTDVGSTITTDNTPPESSL